MSNRRRRYAPDTQIRAIQIPLLGGTYTRSCVLPSSKILRFARLPGHDLPLERVMQPNVWGNKQKRQAHKGKRGDKIVGGIWEEKDSEQFHGQSLKVYRILRFFSQIRSKIPLQKATNCLLRPFPSVNMVRKDSERDGQWSVILSG